MFSLLFTKSITDLVEWLQKKKNKEQDSLHILKIFTATLSVSVSRTTGVNVSQRGGPELAEATVSKCGLTSSTRARRSPGQTAGQSATSGASETT